MLPQGRCKVTKSHRVISRLDEIPAVDQAALLEIAKLGVQIKRIKADLYGIPGSQVEGHVWQEMAMMQIEIALEIVCEHLGASDKDTLLALDKMREMIESLIHHC